MAFTSACAVISVVSQTTLCAATTSSLSRVITAPNGVWPLDSPVRVVSMASRIQSASVFCTAYSFQTNSMVSIRRYPPPIPRAKKFSLTVLRFSSACPAPIRSDRDGHPLLISPPQGGSVPGGYSPHDHPSPAEGPVLHSIAWLPAHHAPLLPAPGCASWNGLFLSPAGDHAPD